MDKLHPDNHAHLLTQKRTFFVLQFLAYMLSCVWLFVTLWTAQLLCPWDFLGKNTGVGLLFLLQRIFSTQGSKLVSYTGRRVLYHWASWEAPLCCILSKFLREISLFFSFKCYSRWEATTLEMRKLLFSHAVHVNSCGF